MYSAVTREIRVDVEPIYLDDQSEPDDGQFVWAYRVQIENEERVTIKALADAEFLLFNLA